MGQDRSADVGGRQLVRHGLHLRGATEGYMRAASKHKKLRIHCGTHFHPFYSEDGPRDQLRFFDYWLKEVDNGVMQEPPVKLAIRTGHGEYHFRHENEWPLARTQWTKLYLDFSKPDGAEGKGIAGTFAKAKPAATAARTYSASIAGHGGHVSGAAHDAGISLVTPPLEQDTEITGPLMAKLWVSSTTEDMDLLLTLRNIDPAGKDVLEVGQQGQPVPVAKGWLRVSHRNSILTCRCLIAPTTSICAGSGSSRTRSSRCRWESWPTVDGVQERGHRIRLDIQPARRHRQRALTRTTTPTHNVGDNTDLFRRRQGILSAGAGHSVRE
jgi:predicted acyl esterase